MTRPTRAEAQKMAEAAETILKHIPRHLAGSANDMPRLARAYIEQWDENEALAKALEQITKILAVGYLNGAPNLPQVEINGVAVCRPIGPAIRQDLGTLFTHLFNAQVALAEYAKRKQEGL